MPVAWSGRPGGEDDTDSSTGPDYGYAPGEFAPSVVYSTPPEVLSVADATAALKREARRADERRALERDAVLSARTGSGAYTPCDALGGPADTDTDTDTSSWRMLPSGADPSDRSKWTPLGTAVSEAETARALREALAAECFAHGDGVRLEDGVLDLGLSESSAASEKRDRAAPPRTAAAGQSSVEWARS